MTGTLGCMDELTAKQRKDLGVRVEIARLARRWSKEEAARHADISSITWKRVEDGQKVQDAKLHAVLDTLGLTEEIYRELKLPMRFGLAIPADGTRDDLGLGVPSQVVSPPGEQLSDEELERGKRVLRSLILKDPAAFAKLFQEAAKAISAGTPEDRN